ncbi:unnamed protein product [Mytilus edulis]|uniref:Protein-tyrosine-phosphatase n=1 Tax=Mytilus edulis TaxID=6550 RepID=A0A8S3T1R7_MYTED|nr:unnamed protein product [Mytilus edulis]
MVIENYRLTLKNETHHTVYVYRLIAVYDKTTQRERNIHHFHFIQWPDQGVPDSINLVNFYRKVVREQHDQCGQHDQSGPMVVHCSAGVGRTGTLIAVDALYEHGKKVGSVDVMEYVQMMKKDRMNMIQTHEQYEVVFEALLELFTVPDTSIPRNNFCGYIEKQENKRLPQNQTMYRQEYQKLQSLKPSYKPAEYKSARSRENIQKNSSKNVYPHDNYRPYLMSFEPVSTDDEIQIVDAHFPEILQPLVSQQPDVTADDKQKKKKVLNTPVTTAIQISSESSEDSLPDLMSSYGIHKALCFGEVDNDSICKKKPIGVRYNAVFIVDLNEVDQKSIYADDNGVWNTASPRSYYRVDIRDGRIENVVPGNKSSYTHYLRRQYGTHQATYNERGVSFQRIISTATSKYNIKSRYAVVQYIHRDSEEGDIVMKAHGNAKDSQSRPFCKTDLSVLDNIKEETRETKPRRLFKKLVDDAGGPLYSSSASSEPRNLQQIYNIRSSTKAATKTDQLTHLVAQIRESTFVHELAADGESLQYVLASEKQLMDLETFFCFQNESEKFKSHLIKAVTDQAQLDGHFSNNRVESTNNNVKDWVGRSGKVTLPVFNRKVEEYATCQQQEFEMAIYANGPYDLASTHTYLRKERHIWNGLNAEERKQVIKQFWKSNVQGRKLLDKFLLINEHAENRSKSDHSLPAPETRQMFHQNEEFPTVIIN